MEIIQRTPTAKGPAATFTGDTIYTAPGEEHWHGAAPDRFMAHLVLMEGGGDEAPQTVWGTAVTDADYQASTTSIR